MGLYAALRSILQADAPVLAIVGTRIYLKVLPANPTVPAITTDGISGVPWGLNTSGSEPLNGTVVQFSCWATTHTASTGLARKVADCMQGYHGVSESVTIGAALVQSSPDANTDYDPDVGLYMTPLDVMVRYSV